MFMNVKIQHTGVLPVDRLYHIIVDSCKMFLYLKLHAFTTLLQILYGWFLPLVLRLNTLRQVNA